MNDFCNANTKTTTNMQSENPNIPAFLGKLWKMVNDPSTDPLICWSSHGKSFVIQNQVQFWVELLPVYYKHNNMSSFVRQLNMYGFHKMSNVENATLDNMDKDEIQFYHPCFQRDRPELLKMIKRKATTRPHDQAPPPKGDDLSQVLIDVEQLRTRQMNVDNQLSIMQGENASMFKELTLLRVKHLRQQQIVNKLIQFLVTLSTPPNPRMGVSVKRRMPLMIHESPNKRFKNRKANHSKDVGPTIRELEEEMGISPGLIDGNTVEEDIPLEALDTALKKDKIQSPLTPSSCSSGSSSIQKDTSPLPNTNLNLNEQPEKGFVWDKPELMNLTEQLNFTENDEDLLNSLQNNPSTDNKEIFLNVTGRDSLIGNLVDPIAYNSGTVATKNKNNHKKQTGNNKNYINAQQRSSLVAAAKDSPQQIRIQNGSDLDSHLDNTQAELDQLKDILHGCESFDTNTVQGLFTHCTDQDGNIIQSKDANDCTVHSKLNISQLYNFVSEHGVKRQRKRTWGACKDISTLLFFDNGYHKDGILLGDPLLTGTALPESMIDFNELLGESLTTDDGPIDLMTPAIITNQLRTPSGLDTP